MSSSADSSPITCDKTNYTSTQGLEFSLSCNQDQTNIGDFLNMGAQTMEECMELCAQTPGQTCAGAAFDSTQLQCFIKNSKIDEHTPVTRNGWVLGVANAAQIQSLTSSSSAKCTSSVAGKNQTTKNGLGFQVLCEQDVGKWDLCGLSATTASCRKHTDSLEDCLEHCSTLHPLCTGVSWDPTVEFGFLNCYPKNGTSRDLFAAKSAKRDTHIGIAALELPAQEEGGKDCDSGNVTSTVTAAKDTVFALSCQEGRSARNMSAVHAGSNAECVDSCVQHDGCVGTAFEATMSSGYENCYLKSDIGDRTPLPSGWTFALRQEAGSSDGSKDSTSKGDDVPSKEGSAGISSAIIAGIVVGCVVGVALLLSLFWWWKRRNRSNPPAAGKSLEYYSRSSTSPQNAPSELGGHTSKQELLAIPPVYELHSSSEPAVYELEHRK